MNLSKIMTLKYLLSFLTAQTIETIDSPINGKIFVEVVNGHYRVSVKKYWQSGKYPESVIKAGLKGLNIDHNNIKHILLLGLGCGSMVKVFNNHFPQALITGVDIDRKMIEIGMKYFELHEIRKLKITISDAFEFVEKYQKKKRYDLIISDIFIGCDTPKSTLNKHFLKMIYRLLQSGGLYICNCSYNYEHTAQTDNFLKIVAGQFLKVEKIIRRPNLIIRAYK